MWRLWKFILRRLALAKGFLDPMVVFSNLQHFSKPSEVWVPVELLRSGAVLQARGLINSQAIQHNLDWVWPFWVQRQFDPNDKAFIPRAFSLTHINLTHRNWTALGLPDCPDLPIVDPCGLVTPFYDGWSVEGWIVYDKTVFLASRHGHTEQSLDLNDTFAVTTTSKSERFFLGSRAEVTGRHDPACTITFSAKSAIKSYLMVCLRPYNPEGISFMKEIGLLEHREGWTVNKKEEVFLDKKPQRYIFANYASGDLCDRLYGPDSPGLRSISCAIGMSTAAALYPLEPGQLERVSVRIPISRPQKVAATAWSEHVEGSCLLKVPDEKFQFLYDAAIRSIILHSPGDIYPGPFTYKRFWFRDAAFILQAMMAVGITRNLERIIDRFPQRQTPGGYFMSQDGEWDSNGQAMWTIERFLDISGRDIKPEWASSIYKAARWIERKRCPPERDPLHAGLLPAGFSAEHFGPSDFYYWDDFWAVAGLRSASAVARRQRLQTLAEDFQHQADDLMNVIETSVSSLQERLRHPGIPTAPSRRMDAGAIGSLVAGYPLQIYPADDERILQTAKFLMDKYFLQGAFYHEISHSGINIYLTLHIAQVLLRAGNPGFFDIVRSVAELATSTGQWPEAIHPRSKGGCMGDGQHMWACAEWIMILRNMFVREEQNEQMLILCSGLPAEWIKPGRLLSLGPTYTLYGEISVALKVTEKYVEIGWNARWHQAAPRIEIRLPGHKTQTAKEDVNFVKIPLRSP